MAASSTRHFLEFIGGAVPKTASDTVASALTEVSAVTHTLLVAVSDTVASAITETHLLAAVKTATDTVASAITETHATIAIFSKTDSLASALVEASLLRKSGPTTITTLLSRAPETVNILLAEERVLFTPAALTVKIQ